MHEGMKAWLYEGMGLKIKLLNGWFFDLFNRNFHWFYIKFTLKLGAAIIPAFIPVKLRYSCNMISE